MNKFVIQNANVKFDVKVRVRGLEGNFRLTLGLFCKIEAVFL